ncbi:MAG: endonuclease/exonuclease/phosphatase family protein [Candidatus Bathyarchaeota archaeon]|nr:endonuclease/exonuclease/phosphatase family protein [Candidatus Bathyarchaeota archaeon]
MKVRISTFNLENLDDLEGSSPSLQERIGILRPQIERLDSDIICFQEIHGQETEGQPRRLLALKKLLENTEYSPFNVASTLTSNNEVYDKRNLVVVSRFPISEARQYNNDLIPSPLYRKITSDPPEEEPKKVEWERPILYTKINVRDDFTINLINLHLKSRLPSPVEGQKIDRYNWKSGSGWAEGFFISSMKRVGQALETRLLVDSIFDDDEEAKIIVCGDLNAHPEEVPIEAISGSIENTGNPSLSKRVMISCEKTIPEPSRFTYLHYGRKRLLDHLLISQSMLPYYRRSEIHNETLHDETIAFATETKFPESDHAPFIAEFEI